MLKYRNHCLKKALQSNNEMCTKMETEMQKLLKEIEAELVIFNEDSKKAAEKGNKMAARRARCATNNLTKLFKDFRKVSVEVVG